ncbi:MAG: glycosyltransferase [Chloroflexi bacterium]|nr:MAG: glycosyltransferase [Chloroflexota bacterium]
MRVTFLTGEYPPMQGGIADHTALLARHLAPLGVSSSVLTARRWQEVAPDSPDPAVHPVIPNWGWRCWPAVAGFVRRHRPDVLHIQYQAAAFDLTGWVNWLARFLRFLPARPRLVVTFHDLRVPYIFPKAGRFRWLSMLALARHCDAVICTNREDRHTLERALRKPPRLAYIPLGSNADPQPPPDFDRAEWRKRYGAGKNSLLLAYFGFMNASKGGEELIEAVALLRQQGIDARLLFVGGEVGHADPTNQAYAARVRGLIQRHGLEAVVFRTGYVDLPQVSANLLAADAVVMPYRDGVSFRRTTLIAALRHGCPVVSTAPVNPAFIPEIRPGENMLLAPPGDAPGLALQIARLVDSPDLRRRLSEAALELGRLFDWPEIAHQTYQLYREVCP